MSGCSSTTPFVASSCTQSSAPLSLSSCCATLPPASGCCLTPTAKSSCCPSAVPSVSCCPTVPSASCCPTTTTATTVDVRHVVDGGNVKIHVTTTQGTLECVIFKNKAPEFCQWFLDLVDAGAYTGVPFHRVWKDCFIQTAGVDASTSKSQAIDPALTNRSVVRDAPASDLVCRHGSLTAVGRFDNGRVATPQFCILHRINRESPCDWLQGVETVFGQVVGGLDVLDSLAQTPVEARADHFGGNEATAPISGNDVPTILSIKRRP